MGCGKWKHIQDYYEQHPEKKRVKVHERKNKTRKSSPKKKNNARKLKQSDWYDHPLNKI